MKKILLTAIMITLMTTEIYAQLGIGASAGMLNPGMKKSDVSQSDFDPGWGYELFIRHNVAQFGDSLMVKARWSYRHYKTTIVLPNVLEIWFKFNYLTLDLLIDFIQAESFNLYAGLGASLVSVKAEKDFLEVTSTEFVPEILVGGEYYLSNNYSLFMEGSYLFGTIDDVGGQSIPMDGYRIVFGATMYLISE
jgi:hypothetical protein